MKTHEVYCGIYLITNIDTGEHYVGQSIDILSRWRQHRADMRSGGGCGENLRESFRRFTEDAFGFSIIQLCDPADLDRLELEWVCLIRPALNSMRPRYRALLAGEAAVPARVSTRTSREKQAQKLKELDARPRCGCGAVRIQGERYCGKCRRKKLGEMSRAGYLVRTYGSSIPKPVSRPVELSY